MPQEVVECLFQLTSYNFIKPNNYSTQITMDTDAPMPTPAIRLAINLPRPGATTPI